jgi:predicted HTH transcriptional regulator
LVGACFVETDISASQIYGNHTAIDIESVIRRSEIELGNYELKQGLLVVAEKGGIDQNIIDKVIKTICAIANNGSESVGKIIIGVTDKDKDAERINYIDKIEPKK